MLFSNHTTGGTTVRKCAAGQDRTEQDKIIQDRIGLLMGSYTKIG